MLAGWPLRRETPFDYAQGRLFHRQGDGGSGAVNGANYFANCAQHGRRTPGNAVSTLTRVGQRCYHLRVSTLNQGVLILEATYD